MKPSSLAWMRLNTVAVIQAAKQNTVRQFVANLIGHTGRLKSLDDLTPDELKVLNQYLSNNSNDVLELSYLEYIKSKVQP
jgi:hypothetical protein